MSTVIICTGMCWMRLARAMDGSKEGSANVIQEWDITAQLHLFSICTWVKKKKTAVHKRHHLGFPMFKLGG